MAGEWLKFEKATPDKPEVFAIAARLNIDPDAVVGKLIRVWSWFDTHTIDGNGRSVTPALLDRISGVSGFVSAMASVGWLVISDDGVSLPNFDRHTGETAKGRALTAKRVAKVKAKGNAKANGDSVTSALPREEKKREEEKQEKRARAKVDEVTFADWVTSLADDDAIRADDPIFGWASKQGIPQDWISYAWAAFEDRYAAKRKTYADWRAAFRDHVKRGWLDIWRLDARSGGFVLTTAGEQWRRDLGTPA